MVKYLTALVLVLPGTSSMSQKIDIQGHRGARGLKPENTIPAFLLALDSGVTTLELDVVISKDGQVVVSHEPWLNPTICLDPEGNKIPEQEERKWNLYEMTYEEIVRCDCGSLGNPRFPEQEKMKVSKPLLSEVIKTAEHHIKSYTQYEVDYNIELKSSPKGDDQYHPAPEEFSRLVYELIDQYLSFDRIVIQSFDFRVLQYWHKYYPEVRLAALIENTNSIGINLASLGFKPDIYSSYHKLLSRKKVQDLHLRSIKVIPWTVNEPKQMKKLIGWGVDGLITDYPDRAKALGLTLDFTQKPN